MKNKILWIGIFIIVLGGIGAWWYSMQSVSQPVVAVASSATVDQKTAPLITDPNLVPQADAAVSLSGTVAPNITSIGVYAVSATYTGALNFTSIKKAEIDGTIHKYNEGVGGVTKIANGKWSTYVQFYDAVPPAGDYTVFVYDTTPSQCTNADVRTCVYPLVATTTLVITPAAQSSTQ